MEDLSFSEKKKQEVFEKKAKEFSKEFEELCQKHKVSMRPIFMKYGLSIELYDITEQKKVNS